MNEVWHSIPGFPRYQMTRTGKIRSLSRREGGKLAPQVLRPRTPPGRRSYYVLSRNFQPENWTAEALWELTFGRREVG